MVAFPLNAILEGAAMPAGNQDLFDYLGGVCVCLVFLSRCMLPVGPWQRRDFLTNPYPVPNSLSHTGAPQPPSPLQNRHADQRKSERKKARTDSRTYHKDHKPKAAPGRPPPFTHLAPPLRLPGLSRLLANWSAISFPMAPLWAGAHNTCTL